MRSRSPSGSSRKPSELTDIHAHTSLRAGYSSGYLAGVPAGRCPLVGGIEGEVVKRRRKETLLIAVHFLQQGVSLVLGDYETEVLW